MLPNKAPTPTSLAEIVSDDFPVLHFRLSPIFDHPELNSSWIGPKNASFIGPNPR
jgi:hypothetical protein